MSIVKHLPPAHAPHAPRTLLRCEHVVDFGDVPIWRCLTEAGWVTTPIRSKTARTYYEVGGFLWHAGDKDFTDLKVCAEAATRFKNKKELAVLLLHRTPMSPVPLNVFESLLAEAGVAPHLPNSVLAIPWDGDGNNCYTFGITGQINELVLAHRFEAHGETRVLIDDVAWPVIFAESYALQFGHRGERLPLGDFKYMAAMLSDGKLPNTRRGYVEALVKSQLPMSSERNQDLQRLAKEYGL